MSLKKYVVLHVGQLRIHLFLLPPNYIAAGRSGNLGSQTNPVNLVQIWTLLLGFEFRRVVIRQAF